MRKRSLKRFFTIDHKLGIVKKQLQAYGRYAQAVFSHNDCKQFEESKHDSTKIETKDLQCGESPPMNTDREDSKASRDTKWISQIQWFDSILEPALQFYRRILPPASTKNGPSPASTRSLVEIATNLHKSASIGMQEWSLGDLTLGIYLLSLQHASEMAVDNLEGEQIFSDFMIQDLIYHVELAKGAYLKDAAALARNSMLRESHVLKFVTNSNLMRPGYYIGVDPRSKLVILGIRGTHTVHDIITDMISTSSHEASFDGFRVHFGTAEAARWFFRHELQTLKVCLEKHQGFKLRLVGHSLGGAAAALLAIMIRRRSEEELGFSPHIVSAVGFATPPCVPKSLAESCQDFVTTVVLQDDAIPRMSASNLAKLRNEILHTDWTRLLESEKGRSVADIITNTIQVLSSVQDAARKYAAYAKFGNSSEGDLNKSNNRKNANTINQSAEPPANMDVPVSSTLKGIKSTHEDLFAPGTLYHIRGRCVTLTGKKVTSGKENCTLWKCNPKEYFRRIVLSRTMLSDHKCDSHYYALRDVLKGLPSSDNKSLT